VTIASRKDGLGGRLSLIKGTLRMQLGFLGKKQEEKRKGKVKCGKDMVGGRSKGQIMVVLTIFRVTLP
jgi:hypothetical protein